MYNAINAEYSLSYYDTEALLGSSLYIWINLVQSNAAATPLQYKQSGLIKMTAAILKPLSSEHFSLV